MMFPHAAQLRSIKYEKLNRGYWDESVGVRIAGRIDTVRQSRPAPVPAVSQADVDREFAALRQRRNEAFPTLRPWPPLSQRTSVLRCGEICSLWVPLWIQCSTTVVLQ